MYKKGYDSSFNPKCQMLVPNVSECCLSPHIRWEPRISGEAGESTPRLAQHASQCITDLRLHWNSTLSGTRPRRAECNVRMPAICKAQTTKQAKASFKARGRPSLTNAETRQLQRSIELEQRAERSKEAEKRRAEAAKKRAEQEKRAKVDREKAQVLSQRRCDKFGFKASQFHLGAFFGKPNPQTIVGKDEEPEQDDIYEDDGLDDEELLKALESPNPRKSYDSSHQVVKSDPALMPPPPRPSSLGIKPSNTVPMPPMDQDLGSFWDDLESSTQIARELNSDNTDQQRHSEPRAESFSSEDFDLTSEDLDELDPPKPVVLTSTKAQRMLPPPKPPMKPLSRAMPPPPRPPAAPAKRLQSKVKAQKAIRGPFLPASSLYCSPELGFTLSQLENFVEDDLQLTQAVSG